MSATLHVNDAQSHDGRGPGAGGGARTPPVRWGLLALAALLVASMFYLGVRYDLQRVESSSMAPTMTSGDLILVDRSAYDNAPIERGDMVVFADPGGWAGNDPLRMNASNELFVKRVIGIGGDHVSCCDADQNLTVNGDVVDEAYLPQPVTRQGLGTNANVPEERLWVMGDNRSSSIDSRHLLSSSSLGYVSEENVIGRVVLTIPFFGS